MINPWSHLSICIRPHEAHGRSTLPSYVRVSRPLASGACSRLQLGLALTLEFLVQDAGWGGGGTVNDRDCMVTGWKTLTENVITKLRMLQAERAELLLGLSPEGVAASSPEVGDGGADRGVLLASVGVDITRVGNLALGRGVHAVDLPRSQLLQLLDAEFLGQGVGPRMLEQLVTRLVDVGYRGVGFERLLAGDLAREVVSGVEKLEEAADRVDIVGGELNLARLLRTTKSVSDRRKCAMGGRA
jgi:hypothetical protein